MNTYNLLRIYSSCTLTCLYDFYENIDSSDIA